jgi:hypothetical protein
MPGANFHRYCRAFLWPGLGAGAAGRLKLRAYVELSWIRGCCSVAGATISSGVRAWCVSVSTTKFSREMGVVAKATGIGDLAQWLACSERPPTVQKARRMIQPERVYKFAAGQAARGKKLLEITQGNPGDCCHLTRSEIRIGEAVPDDAADTRKQLVHMT